MSSVRDGIEQAVLISIGAASLTRERAEAAVSDLVRRGHIGSDEGKKAVDRLMGGLRGEDSSSPAAALVHRLEGGLQGVLREVGVATRAEHDDLQVRIDALEHRIALLERASSNPAQTGPTDPADTAATD